MAGSYQSPVFAWIQLVLGILALVLAGMSFSQANASRDFQKTAAANQTRLERANTFANLDNGLIQLVAKSAADNNDTALTTLLSDNGVTFRRPPTADAGAKP